MLRRTNKWTIRQGATFTQTLNFTDKTTGTGRDITGATIYFTVKTAPDSDATDATAVIKKDITTHTTPLDGVSMLALTKTDTAVTAGSYKGDLKIVYADGEVDQTPIFDVVIEDGITNRG